MSASFVDLGTRPLRIFAPLLALGGLVMIGFGIYFLATYDSSTRIVAEGASGSSIEVPYWTEDLAVWAHTGSGEVVTTGSCETDATDEVLLEGLLLHNVDDTAISAIEEDRSGAVVLTCTTAQPTTITVGYEPGPDRLIQGGGAIVIGLGALLMAGIGFLLRRRR